MKYNILLGASNIYLAHAAPKKEHLGTNSACQLGTESLAPKGPPGSRIGTWLLAAATLANSDRAVQMLIKTRFKVIGTSFSQRVRFGIATNWSFTNRATHRRIWQICLCRIHCHGVRGRERLQ